MEADYTESFAHFGSLRMLKIHFVFCRIHLPQSKTTFVSQSKCTDYYRSSIHLGKSYYCLKNKNITATSTSIIRGAWFYTRKYHCIKRSLKQDPFYPALSADWFRHSHWNFDNLLFKHGALWQHTLKTNFKMRNCSKCVYRIVHFFHYFRRNYNWWRIRVSAFQTW